MPKLYQVTIKRTIHHVLITKNDGLSWGRAVITALKAHYQSPYEYQGKITTTESNGDLNTPWTERTCWVTTNDTRTWINVKVIPLLTDPEPTPEPTCPSPTSTP